MPGKIRDLIRASTGEGFGQVPKNSGIQASTEKWWNPGEYRKRVKFGRVPENGPGEYRRKLRASTGEGFGQVLKKLRASTREGFGRVLEKLWASTGEGSGRVPEKGPGEYRKMVESGPVLEKGPGE